MAIQSQPSRIPEPFAGSGTKNVIPATNASPSASQAASWASGFPPECSQPISAGGCPVPRGDVNGALNQLSQDYAFRQDGGVWGWSASADYDLQRIVRGSDGLLYCSVAQSGPGVAAGAQDPTADDGTHWRSPQVPTLPAADVSNHAVNSEWVNNWLGTLNLPSALYVDGVNGDDDNDGLTAATAKKTINAARLLYANSLLWLPWSVSIYIAPGTYAENLGTLVGPTLYYYAVDGAVTIQGNLIAGRKASVALGGTFVFSGSSSRIEADRGGIIQLGAAGDTSISFSGLSASSAIAALTGGMVFSYNGQTLALSFSSCTFTSGTVHARYQGFVNLNGTTTFSGSASGRRYQINDCAGVYIAGAGASSIPGDSAGTVDSTSYYGG